MTKDESENSSSPKPQKTGEVGGLATELLQMRNGLDKYLKILKAITEERYLDAEQLLGRNKSLSAKLSKSVADSVALISQFDLGTAVASQAASSRLYYRDTFERLLNKLALQWNGTWPTYTVGDLVRVEFDLGSHRALLDGKRLTSLEPHVVAQQISRRISLLLERSRVPREFLRLVRETYDAYIASLGEVPGTYADIREILKRVKQALKTRSDKRYAEDQFSTDLYRVIQQGAPTCEDGAILQLSPAQDAAGGIYVPAPGGGNYIAALRFVRSPNAK